MAKTDSVEVTPATPTPKNPSFWTHAELIRTYPANHTKVRMIKARCNILYGKDALKQVRKYKNEKTGERKTTIEIEFK